MGSRCLGELLLRPSTLARISPLPRRAISTPRQTIAPSWTARSLSNTSRPPAPQPALKVQEQEADDDAPRRPRRASNAETSQAIDSLFSGLPDTRPRPPQTASSDQLRAARASHIFGSEFSSPGRGRSRRPPGLNFDDMTMPDELANPTLANKPVDTSLAQQQEETFANYPRLNPTYGRTVDLDASRGRDIVRGIGMLGSLVARNHIRKDVSKQKFHERGGLKRKRLLSERWRARFKKGFVAVTARVSELTRKGW
ncbi:hypothetical protein P153DRAFT_370344 [Dothidotthia symphoricarpi CBS 119687]|uniref:Ribosomal protein S21 n=1 Tax=Dothidotthia symphoricarpi CBS 119687 TaxID=1392245 RepID=A0A6A5ZZ56_9PLEO|nr:uncharacterized protein P153DRAFT_370344 [Dothidotthia symphoricarpi CBS 119687]KAF2125022.1 hypothetical protein P153DRAFT_370344 [Dothidotthia symphoricarpi CBS 119687]